MTTNKSKVTDFTQEKLNYTVQENKSAYRVVKRILDIVLSLIAIIVLAIPMLIVALIIVMDSPGASPIFMQTRVGKNGKEFKFFKFRSMVPNAEDLLESLLDKNEMQGPAFKMKDDPRVTTVGKFLRRTSIDELPQIINILLGDMSFVGPRPPLPREVAQYTSEQKLRLMITPGLTCYWQVQSNRNDISFDQWLALDLKYIEECSFKTDVYIIFKTVRVVLGQEGV